MANRIGGPPAGALYSTSIGIYKGENTTASESYLHFPRGICTDQDESVYIVDTYNHRIRKIDYNNTITTLSGNGEQGFNGDGMNAMSASLDSPGFCLVYNHSLYFTDGNSRIRKIDLETKIISTVVGTGMQGYSEDGILATNAQIDLNVDSGFYFFEDELYLADTNNDRIRKMNSSGYIETFFEGADLTNTIQMPISIVFYNGVLLISEQSGHTIKAILPNKTIVTFAGNGNAGFSGDGGNVCEATFSGPTQLQLFNNELYISDLYNYRIRKVLSNQTIVTVVGNGVEGFSGDGGLPTNASLSGAACFAFDVKQNYMYIADSNNHRIRRVKMLSNLPSPQQSSFIPPNTDSFDPSILWIIIAILAVFLLLLLLAILILLVVTGVLGALLWRKKREEKNQHSHKYAQVAHPSA